MEPGPLPPPEALLRLLGRDPRLRRGQVRLARGGQRTGGHGHQQRGGCGDRARPRGRGGRPRGRVHHQRGLVPADGCHQGASRRRPDPTGHQLRRRQGRSGHRGLLGAAERPARVEGRHRIQPARQAVAVRPEARQAAGGRGTRRRSTDRHHHHDHRPHRHLPEGRRGDGGRAGRPAQGRTEGQDQNAGRQRLAGVPAAPLPQGNRPHPPPGTARQPGRRRGVHHEPAYARPATQSTFGTPELDARIADAGGLAGPPASGRLRRPVRRAERRGRAVRPSRPHARPARHLPAVRYQPDPATGDELRLAEIRPADGRTTDDHLPAQAHRLQRHPPAGRGAGRVRPGPAHRRPGQPVPAAVRHPRAARRVRRRARLRPVAPRAAVGLPRPGRAAGLRRVAAHRAAGRRDGAAGVPRHAAAGG